MQDLTLMFWMEEIRRAVDAGVDLAFFPDQQGSQVRVVPNPTGHGYLCPAFDSLTSHCRIYSVRPLDCQIYPLALMWSADGRHVLLGWDSKCPFLSQRGTGREARGGREGVEEYAERIAAMIEQEETLEVLAGNPRLIGRFQEDVMVLRSLPRLTARVCGRLAHPSPPALRPLTLADRPRLEEAVAAVDTPLATYAFAPHFIWRELFTYSWAEIDGHFCLFAEYADGIFMPLPPLLPEARGTRQAESGLPLSGEAFAGVLAQCLGMMRTINRGTAVSRIENVPQAWRSACEALGYRVRPKDPDYLYRAEDLAALAGDRYKSQRAACNRFMRTRQYRVEPYDTRHQEDCLGLFKDWTRQKRSQGVEPIAEQMLGDAAPAHREALAHSHELGLTGFVLWIDDKIRAYTFGFERQPSVFCVLLEVADRQIPGLAQFVFRETCRQALQRGTRHINTMDDSGLPGLAQSKRAYHPIQLVENYVVTEER